MDLKQECTAPGLKGAEYQMLKHSNLPKVYSAVTARTSESWGAQERQEEGNRTLTASILSPSLQHKTTRQYCFDTENGCCNHLLEVSSPRNKVTIRQWVYV